MKWFTDLFSKNSLLTEEDKAIYQARRTITKTKEKLRKNKKVNQSELDNMKKELEYLADVLEEKFENPKESAVRKTISEKEPKNNNSISEEYMTNTTGNNNVPASTANVANPEVAANTVQVVEPATDAITNLQRVSTISADGRSENITTPIGEQVSTGNDSNTSHSQANVVTTTDQIQANEAAVVQVTTAKELDEEKTRRKKEQAEGYSRPTVLITSSSHEGEEKKLSYQEMCELYNHERPGKYTPINLGNGSYQFNIDNVGKVTMSTSNEGDTWKVEGEIKAPKVITFHDNEGRLREVITIDEKGEITDYKGWDEKNQEVGPDKSAKFNPDFLKRQGAKGPEERGVVKIQDTADRNHDTVPVTKKNTNSTSESEKPKAKQESKTKRPLNVKKFIKKSLSQSGNNQSLSPGLTPVKRLNSQGKLESVILARKANER